MRLATAPTAFIALGLSLVAARERLTAAQKAEKLLAPHSQFTAVVESCSRKIRFRTFVGSLFLRLSPWRQISQQR